MKMDGQISLKLLKTTMCSKLGIQQFQLDVLCRCKMSKIEHHLKFSRFKIPLTRL